MKLLHLINSADPEGGGPIACVQQLSLLAIEEGHEVDVMSLDSPQASWLPSFPLPLFPVGPGRTSYGYTGNAVAWLKENAARYDVVIVNGIWQYHSFACWQALRNIPVPYVVFTHGMLDPWFKREYPLKHLKKWLYWPWAEYRVLRDAAAVLFTCETERLLARESFWLYKARERVVSFGTAPPPDRAEVQSKAFSKRFPETNGKRLLLFMGRIHPKKGVDLAISSFASALASTPDWHLVIAGPDQIGWQAQLQQLARECNVEDRITWTGMLKGDEKWGAIRAAEAFFLPSHQENFGLVVAEALSCSVPVLISREVNIWREVESHGAGLTASDDLKGACRLLQQWDQASDDVKRDMRRSARALFCSRFDITAASNSLIAALKDVVHSGGRIGAPNLPVSREPISSPTE